MSAAPSTSTVDSNVLQHIVDALAALQYGVVEITVHDGRVVQIERREKIRIGAAPRPRA